MTDLDIIRQDMLAISEGSQVILVATESAEAGAREAQRGAESVASAAEEQSSATSEAQQAVQQQSTALDQSQTTAHALAQLAEGLQNDRGTASSSEQLASAAEELSATVQELSGAASQILTAIDQIGIGAQAQAAATQQSSAAMTQIENAAMSIRTAAAQAGERIRNFRRRLRPTEWPSQKLYGCHIGGSRQKRSLSARCWQRWRPPARRIEKIVDSISLVAVQTNMLAVSGSVEAARAREFGRGFAVVSSDIRNLSRQSADNAGRAKDVAVAIQARSPLFGVTWR